MMIQGFKEGLKLLGTGDKATLFIPYYLAYGETESRGIPAKSNLNPLVPYVTEGLVLGTQIPLALVEPKVLAAND